MPGSDAGSIHRRGRKLIGVLSATPGIILLLIVIAIPVTRSLAVQSVMVEAETTTVSFIFAGNDTTWSFATAIECIERKVPDFATEDGSGPCSARFYEVADPAPWSWTFESGDEIALDLRPDGYVALDFGIASAGDQRIIVVVPTSDWGTTGALAFDGAVRIGEVPGSGTRTYLDSGRFEIREKLPWQAGTEVVKSGEFAFGEAVSVWSRSNDEGLCLPAGDPASPREPCEAVVFGHITLSGDSNDLLHVMTVSRAGSPELRVSYAGGIEPRLIRPTWIDSVLTNPALLAAALVMSLLTSAIPLMLEGYRMAKEDARDNEGIPAVAKGDDSLQPFAGSELERAVSHANPTGTPVLDQSAETPQADGAGSSGAPNA